MKTYKPNQLKVNKKYRSLTGNLFGTLISKGFVPNPSNDNNNIKTFEYMYNFISNDDTHLSLTALSLSKTTFIDRTFLYGK